MDELKVLTNHHARIHPVLGSGRPKIGIVPYLGLSPLLKIGASSVGLRIYESSTLTEDIPSGYYTLNISLGQVKCLFANILQADLLIWRRTIPPTARLSRLNDMRVGEALQH